VVLFEPLAFVGLWIEKRWKIWMRERLTIRLFGFGDDERHITRSAFFRLLD